MPALFDQTTIDVSAKGKNGVEYTFRATGSVKKFDGFLKVYVEGKDQVDEDDEEMKHRLPAVVEGEHSEVQSHPAGAALHRAAAALQRSHAGETPGIRRRGPSVHLRFHPFHHSGARVREEGRGRFQPTELGMVVTDLLLESFDDIFDVTYTARMEEELDEIEDGKIDWRAAMDEFYERFDRDLKHAEEHMTDIKRMEKPTDLTCEKCGKPAGGEVGQARQLPRLHRLSRFLAQECRRGHRRSCKRRSPSGRSGRTRIPTSVG
jgi:DNA topoisomerase I